MLMFKYVCSGRDVIYSNTRAYVWPRAVRKACSLRNESLSIVCVSLCVCVIVLCL